MRRNLIFITIAMAMLVTLPLNAGLNDKVADRLWESSKVIDELLNAPDRGIPRELFQRAECVAVIPSVKRVAFVFGGRYGRGAVSCRADEGKGPWTAPSMIGLGGGSFGLQLGGQAVDVVMLFMTPDSLKYLLRDKVSLGGDVSAAAGPIGRAASAETSASFRAEILTYSRSRGLFAGLALSGAVLRPDEDANQMLYARPVHANEILQESTAIPEPAKKFIDALTRASS